MEYWTYQLNDDAEYQVQAVRDVTTIDMVGICLGEEEPPIAYVKPEYAQRILNLLETGRERKFVPADTIV